VSVVLDEPGIRVEADRCTRTVADGPHDLVGPPAYELCLVRDGSFHLRSHSIDVLADSVTALLGAPLEQAEIFHPVPGGDATTHVFLSEQVVADLGGGTADVVSGAHLTTPHIDLLHRQLARAAAATGGTREMEELALRLFASVMAQTEPTRVTHGRPTTARARRALVREAHDALVRDTDLGLVAMAHLLGCSPHHLSRLFREHTGITLSRCRTRLRVNQALELLRTGEDTLAVIAARCGFADHAHLSRTIRRELDTTPSELRLGLQANAHENSSADADHRRNLGPRQ